MKYIIDLFLVNCGWFATR